MRQVHQRNLREPSLAQARPLSESGYREMAQDSAVGAMSPASPVYGPGCQMLE